jgi:hypothetical protein
MSVEPLWALRGKRSVVRCVLQVEPTWAELLLLQDENVAAREVFQNDKEARQKATALREQLLTKGWAAAS